ncbi:DUF4309 domain-containing protein [Brevibacillus ruminantium]|uniref:DUF4309 domain-containing protein n=1 Tax=Brevibacillus ruminantium TaxID=2950604 RepID=A0ABY4WI13_9BACL|nr:DUF4309 domain-containing protein [Brevibacillus ruminantium]USG66742.1 DUF4309 domain-containing protein [Brevibacillus ruminantium]
MKFRFFAIVFMIFSVLTGCMAAESEELEPLHQLLKEMKSEAENGRMKGIDLPLGATLGEVQERYGKPKSFSNDECWTYSFDHPDTDAVFFYQHDACSQENEQITDDIQMNKITVSPSFFQITVHEKDIRKALGQPSDEYENEAYGGYYLKYRTGDYQLIFVIWEDSVNREITRVSIALADR